MKSESAAQVSTLAAAPPSVPLEVVAVGPRYAGAVGETGLRHGVRVTIERRLPFGGPVLVLVGQARVALARSVAETVEVRPSLADRDGGPR